MIKMNEFASNSRQDDLLERLKQCVGSIEPKSKDLKSNPTNNRLSEQFKNKQPHLNFKLNLKQQLPDYSTNTNKTQRKYVDKQQEYSFLSNRNSLTKNQNSDILQLTKNYLEGPSSNQKPYKTDRKHSLPLTEISTFMNLKKQLFTKQKQSNQPKKAEPTPKEVSQSTRKRIAERQSLINDESFPVKIKKPTQNPKNPTFSSDQFLQRLSLKKNAYNDNNNTNKQKRTLSQKQKEQETYSSQKQSSNEKSIYPQNSWDSKRNQAQNLLREQKYNFCSKSVAGISVKQYEMRKAEKLEKLRKITQINQEINKKIKKIVDSFQNYLTNPI